MLSTHGRPLPCVDGCNAGIWAALHRLREVASQLTALPELGCAFGVVLAPGVQPELCARLGSRVA